MAFNSFQYLALLVLVLLLYARSSARIQNVVLLIASYVFYGFWDWRFLSLLWVSTAVDYTVGRRLQRTEDQRRRKLLLAVSVTANLGMLGFFKYFGFFAASAAALASRMGATLDAPTLSIVLPVGISFYTFQTMSYTIDVYRQRTPTCRDPLAFAVYVAFFPQLVAGPIERAGHLLPQFQQRRAAASGDRLWSGLHLIGLGLFRKVVIADTVAPFVNNAFDGAAAAGWVNLAVGLVAFSLQIYGDFAGYSDIARGSARLLGVELMENFNQPYLARNISHFWRTWHISLSTWLHDYLYIPLGGNRKGDRRTVLNLMVTMLLGGLWHGASWTFVVWGGLHGIYLAIHRTFRHRTAGAELDHPRLRDVPAIVGTLVAVGLAWVFFRAPSFRVAADYLSGLLRFRTGPVDRTAIAIVFAAAAVSLVIDVAQRRARDHTALRAWPVARRGFAYGLAAVAFIVFSGAAPIPFIYFQF